MSLNLCPDSARTHHHKQDCFIYWQTKIWRESFDASWTIMSFLFLFPYSWFPMPCNDCKGDSMSHLNRCCQGKPALSLQWEGVDVPDIWMCRYTTEVEASLLTRWGRDFLKSGFCTGLNSTRRWMVAIQHGWCVVQKSTYTAWCSSGSQLL